MPRCSPTYLGKLRYFTHLNRGDAGAKPPFAVKLCRAPFVFPDSTQYFFQGLKLSFSHFCCHLKQSDKNWPGRDEADKASQTSSETRWETRSVRQTQHARWKTRWEITPKTRKRQAQQGGHTRKAVKTPTVNCLGKPPRLLTI